MPSYLGQPLTLYECENDSCNKEVSFFSESKDVLFTYPKPLYVRQGIDLPLFPKSYIENILMAKKEEYGREIVGYIVSDSLSCKGELIEGRRTGNMNTYNLPVTTYISDLAEYMQLKKLWGLQLCIYWKESIPLTYQEVK